MISLSQPLTIEDWLGNVYLLKPKTKENDLPTISRKSVIFKKPILKERKSKMIKRIMVATTIDKQCISSLLRSLKQQLEVDLNLDSIKVFKMNSNTPHDINENSKNNNHKREEVDENIDDKYQDSLSRLSSTLEPNLTESDQSPLVDSFIDQHISNFRSTKSKKKSETEESILDKIYDLTNLTNEINDKSHNKETNFIQINGEIKFTFFTFWSPGENIKKNYFHLPNDNLTDEQSKLISGLIRDSRKHLLISYLKMIEKIAESQIKYKKIIQSHRVEELFFRKVVISSKRRDDIWLTLQLVKEHLPGLIRNAVFYQPSLEQNSATDSPEPNSELKSSSVAVINNKIHYATENYVTNPMIYCKLDKKLSKIPVLLIQNYRLHDRGARKSNRTLERPAKSEGNIVTKKAFPNQHSNSPTGLYNGNIRNKYQ